MWVALLPCSAAQDMGAPATCDGSPVSAAAAAVAKSVGTRHVTRQEPTPRKSGRDTLLYYTSKKPCFGQECSEMESKFLQHGLGSTYVEGDDDAGRVVLGQLDGGAEKAVEVVVRGHEPGTCAERTAAGRLSQRPYARLERGHGARGSRVRAEVKGKGGGKGWEEEDATGATYRSGGREGGGRSCHRRSGRGCRRRTAARTARRRRRSARRRRRRRTQLIATPTPRRRARTRP